MKQKKRKYRNIKLKRQMRISLCVKMSYGKDDFLDWDDDGLDLGALLGEYTCSEIEITDDEVQSKRSKKNCSERKNLPL